MNVCTKFHSNLSHNYLDISVWAKVVAWLTYCQTDIANSTAASVAKYTEVSF